MDAALHRQAAQRHYDAYKKSGDAKHFTMHLRHSSMARYIDRLNKHPSPRSTRREEESQQLLKQTHGMLKAQLDTNKIDPQPWTIHSKIFEMKEGGKAMNAQKSLDLINSMIKSTQTCKARLGSVKITPKGPVHEASGFPLQGHGGAYHILDIGREAKERDPATKKRAVTAVLSGADAKRMRPAAGWGRVLREVHGEKEKKSIDKAQGEVQKKGEEPKNVEPYWPKGARIREPGGYKRIAPRRPGTPTQEAARQAKTEAAMAKEGKVAIDKAGLFGGESQESTPASHVMSKLGGSAPSTPGQGGSSGSLKPGQTISMQSVVPKKDMGAAVPAHEPGAMQPGQTVSMKKIASAGKSLPVTKAAPLPARSAGEGRGPSGDPIYLQEMGAKPGAKRVVKEKKEPKLYINKAKDVPCAKCGSTQQLNRYDGTGVCAACAMGTTPKKPKSDKDVSKALSASAIPRLPRALAHAIEQYRSATAVMTRGNSRFAKNVHTGPLTGEVIQDLEEDAAVRTRTMPPVYKSCGGCGRTYMAKSADAECPTCSVNKSMLCTCGQTLVKGPTSSRYCPLCG